MNGTETYNGWTNRETWAVALWINNDQGWQERTAELVRDALETSKQARTEGDLPEWNARLAASYAGDAVRDDIDQLTDPAEGLMPTVDIVSFLKDVGSLYRVDWAEIGASFLEDV